jgi:hypothetical protein
MITHASGSDAPKPARGKAIADCMAMFLLYEVLLVALLFALQRFGSPYLKAIPMPRNAPATWWRVDENAALVGLSDLIAALVPVAFYCWLRKRRFVDLDFNRGGTLGAWLLVAAGEAWLVYVLAKRSLWPTIAAHIINDAVVIPSVYYLMVVMRSSH